MHFMQPNSSSEQEIAKEVCSYIRSAVILLSLFFIDLLFTSITVTCHVQSPFHLVSAFSFLLPSLSSLISHTLIFPPQSSLSDLSFLPTSHVNIPPYPHLPQFHSIFLFIYSSSISSLLPHISSLIF